MKVFLKRYNVKEILKLTVAICLWSLLLGGLVCAQQTERVSDERIPASNNFANAAVPKVERYEMFRYTPIKGSDDVNVQFYLTTALALAVGFDQDTANSIGLYNQYVDDNPKTSPVKWSNFKARRDFHFTSQKQRAKLWQAFVEEPDTAHLGMYLHAKQDSYFHAGYNYLIGHLFKGVRPDQSWRPENAAKARQAAQATFDELLKATSLLSASESPLNYSDIESQTISFLNAPDDAERGIKFALLLQRIAALRGQRDNDVEATLRQIDQAIKGYSYSPTNWRNKLSQLAVRDKD